MALDPNMMRWVSLIVYDELQKCCDSMSLNGEDRKVYEICMQDFRNYLLYLERNHQKLDNSSSPELILNGEVIGEVISISITNRLFGLHQDSGSTKEVAEFVHWWIQWWWKKWQQRTQIVFKSPPNALKELFIDHLSALHSQFTANERDEFLQIMTDKLIQYGEICCSSILAEALFKKDIQASQKTEWTTQEKINLISRLQREAREITYTHGVLVFIKPDKSYGLREWRDDNANKII